MLMTANGIGSVLGSVLIVMFRRRGAGARPRWRIRPAADALRREHLDGAVDRIMGLIGVAQAIYLAMNNTLVQLAVPDHLHGRVMSVYMTTWGLMPLGALPRVSWPTGSAPRSCWPGRPAELLIVLVMAVRSPTLRRL